MRRRFLPQLTYANVVSTLALVLVVGGGAAYAADTIGSSDVIDETLLSQDVKNGEVKNPDLASGSVLTSKIANGDVRSADVGDELLTGQDIKDNSGVDTCPTPATLRFGQICAGTDGSIRTWPTALEYCTNLGLRLPTVAEAVVLAKGFDVPQVAATQRFWTDEELYIGSYRAEAVDDTGTYTPAEQTDTHKTVCVTTPTN